MSHPTPPADQASPPLAMGGRGPWLSEGHHAGRSAIYNGSLPAFRGAPVWVDRVIDTVDDGSLLGVDLYQVTLADGTGTLLGVRATSLEFPAPTLALTTDPAPPRLAHPPARTAAPAARPAARDRATPTTR